MIQINSFHHRFISALLTFIIALAFWIVPGAFAAPGDTCQNAEGVNVDQMCDIGAGELCKEGVCVYVPLEEGGTGLGGLPTGEVQISSSIVQDRTFGELLILMVNYFIGFLGVVATIMFVYAGVLWVVSAGSEDLIDKAKKIMTYSSLGILVILISFAAVRFITSAADGAAGTGGGNNQGGNSGQSFQCSVTSDCGAGQYCFQEQCKESVKVTCQDDSQCGTGGQCSPLGVCFDSNAGSGFSCQNDANCNLGFVCNLGSNQCDLAGVGLGGGILGGDTQAEAEEGIQAVDALVNSLDGKVDEVNDQIDDMLEPAKSEVIFALKSGSLKDKKAGLQALMEQSTDSALTNTLQEILTYLERLEDLQVELEDLKALMPESLKTIEAYDKASLSLEESINEPRSSIKYRRFEKDYGELKTLIRQFPVVQSRIQAIPGEGNVPFTVTLNGLDSLDPTGGTISEYKWSFLDNKGNLVSLGNDPVVVHTFTEPNTYSVRLQVSTSQTDESGYKMATDGVSVIRIKANPPASKVDFRINGKEVADVYHVTLEEAKAGLSLDPSTTTPAFGRVIDHYQWLFGDGLNEIRSTPSAVVHSYSTPGEYLLTLKIRDNAGIEDRKVVKLTLKSLAADAKISPSQGNVNTQFTFNGSGSRSDNGSINQYQWEVLDSEGQTIDSFQDPTVNYQFKKPGNYEVALTITDTSGQTDRRVIPLTVLSREPVANFSYKNPQVNSPATVLFDASNSYDSDEGDILTYSWDFDGDGGFEVVESKEAIVDYTYRQSGNYKVILQVQDSFGQSHQVEKNVAIDSTLGGEIVLDKKSFRVGEEVTFKADSPVAVAYLWDFGDGQTANTEEEAVTHTYAKKGKYQVKLHFFDREDNSNTDTLTILVGDQDTPLALAQATVNEYTPTLTPDACGPGQEAMVVTRSDRVAFSAADSVNTDGSSRLLDYTWELSEEVQNTGRDFSYRFTQLTPGDQCATATLRVKDQISGKVSETDTLFFKVVNATPTLADFVLQPISEELTTPTKVLLKAVNPKDEDGQIKLYRWWYISEGNEQQKLGVHSTTLPETEMTLVAQGQPGVENRYIFVLEMTDNDNGKFDSLESYGSLTQLDVVNGPNLSPVAEFTVDKTTIAVGDSITFVSKSYDPQGETLPNSAFRWDFDGDGNYDDTTTGPQVSHPYNSPGQYQVRLNVNYRGLSSTVNHTVNVEATNAFPQAAFTYVTEGNTVHFSAINSRATASLQQSPLTYEWDFDIKQDSNGNGSNDDDVESTELSPDFTYPRAGIYTVRLKIKDSSGTQGVVVRQVNLNLTQQQWEQNRFRSLGIKAVNRPLTQLKVSAVPLNMQVGESTEITAEVENADLTPYKGNVFFEILEGSGELTANPALGSAARNSQATTIFTSTAPGPVRLRVKAANTFHGDITEDIVLQVN